MQFKSIHRSLRLSLAVAMSAFASTVVTTPIKAEYWQPHECFMDYDANYNLVEVCMDGYNIGIFWADGSYVNGYCTSRSDYNVDYYGLSKRDAISWVDYYC
tara:strand:- start:173 stop:475 length:303 start_codon:yes stop_codon:yes gene_type:complete